MLFALAAGAVQAEHGAAGAGGCRPAEVVEAGSAASSAGCGLASEHPQEEGVEELDQVSFSQPY